MGRRRQAAATDTGIRLPGSGHFADRAGRGADIPRCSACSGAPGCSACSRVLRGCSGCAARLLRCAGAPRAPGCSGCSAKRTLRSLGTCYTSAQGMLGMDQNLRWGRGLVAACLAVLFSFSSLAPIAARSLNDAADMPCCKTKGKCCCRSHRRSNATGGATIAAAGCLDCGSGTLGGVSASSHIAIRLQVLAPATDVACKVPVGAVVPQPHFPAHSLRQRPPPPHPLA